MNKFSLGLLLLTLAAGLAGQEGKDALQRELEREVMAPCCYGGPVSEHESEAAKQVRGQITQLIGEGRTREEILDMYVAIYGERILAQPRAEGFNLMAYVMPPMFLLVGGILLVYIINQMKTPATATSTRRKKTYSDEFFDKVEREMKEMGI